MPRPSVQARPSTRAAAPETVPPWKPRPRSPERSRRAPREETPTAASSRGQPQQESRRAGRAAKRRRSGSPIKASFDRPRDREAVARAITKLCRYSDTRPAGIVASGGGSWLSIPEIASVLSIPMATMQVAIASNLWSGKSQGRLRLHVVQSPTEALVAAAENSSGRAGADVASLSTNETATLPTIETTAAATREGAPVKTQLEMCQTCDGDGVVRTQDGLKEVCGACGGQTFIESTRTGEDFPWGSRWLGRVGAQQVHSPQR